MNSNLDISIRTSALVAGTGLLLIGLVAILTNIIVLECMVVNGDAGATIDNIRRSLRRFRPGIAGFLIIAILDIVVAAALYVLLRPAAATLAMLIAALRLVYAGMLGFSLLNLLVVAGVVDGSGAPAGVEPGQQAAYRVSRRPAPDSGESPALAHGSIDSSSVRRIISAISPSCDTCSPVRAFITKRRTAYS